MAAGLGIRCMSSSSSSSSAKVAALVKGLAFALTIESVLVGHGGVCEGLWKELRFNSGTGTFKILQVSDMHYANGASSNCRDVLPSQEPYCSDLNTTAFLRRMIRAENPDLIVFTGDIIYGDASDARNSLNAALAPAIESNIPWAAGLGNHDQESTLTRENVMKHIVTMKNTLSELNPYNIEFTIDGYGNYNLEVFGAKGSEYQDTYVLNLYFLDSGDYSKNPFYPGYGWIQDSQKEWFERVSSKLRKEFDSDVGLAFFHIPLPEYGSVSESEMTGVKQEKVSSPRKNSGFFATMKNAGDVKAVLVGHDHKNDFCGEVSGIKLCYAGGFGYHAYGKAGWERRSRVVEIELGRGEDEGGYWGKVGTIKTWKRLDDENLTMVDEQTLWTKEETTTADGDNEMIMSMRSSRNEL